MALGPAAAGPADARSGADGRFETRSSSHFVLHQDVDIDEHHGLRGSRRFEQRVLEVLEAAHAQLDERLGLRAPRRLDVWIWDAAVFDERFAGLFRFPAAGFYGDAIHVRGDVVVHEPLARTLRHELVHASWAAVAPSLVLPAWLNEGVAEWFEARVAGVRHLAPAEETWLAQRAAAGGLFSLDALGAPSFGRFGPEAAGLAYLQSRAFVAWLARRSGERSLRELCRELVRTGRLDRAVRKAFRSDLPRLEAQFASELARQGGS